MRFLYTFIFFCLSQTYANSANIESLGERHLKKFRETTSSWTAIHGDPKRSHMEVDVVKMSSYIDMALFSATPGRKRRLIANLTIFNKKWYVQQNGENRIYRAFEAPFSMTNALRYFLTSKPQFLTPNTQNLIGSKSSENQENVYYRKKVSPEEYQAIRQQLKEYAKIIKDEKYSDSQKRTVGNIADKLVEIAQNGRQSIVDKATGMITKLHIKDKLISINDFTYCDNKEKLPHDLLDPEEWQDLSSFWLFPTNTKQLLGFDRNGHWLPRHPKSNTDAVVIDSHTGDTLRIPFKGYKSRLIGFNTEKTAAYVIGKRLGSEHQKIWYVNLITSQQKPIAQGLLNNRNCHLALLSPSGRQLAIMTAKTNSLYLLNTEAGSIRFIHDGCRDDFLEWQSEKLLYAVGDKRHSYPKGEGVNTQAIKSFAEWDLHKKDDTWCLIKSGKEDIILDWPEELFSAPNLSRDNKRILFIRRNKQRCSLESYSLKDGHRTTLLEDLPGLWVNPQD